MAVAQEAPADNGVDDSGCTLAAPGSTVNSVFTLLLPGLMIVFAFGRRLFRRKK